MQTKELLSREPLTQDVVCGELHRPCSLIFSSRSAQPEEECLVRRQTHFEPLHHSEGKHREALALVEVEVEVVVEAL